MNSTCTSANLSCSKYCAIYPAFLFVSAFNQLQSPANAK